MDSSEQQPPTPPARKRPTFRPIGSASAVDATAAAPQLNAPPLSPATPGSLASANSIQPQQPPTAREQSTPGKSRKFEGRGGQGARFAGRQPDGTAGSGRHQGPRGRQPRREQFDEQQFRGANNERRSRHAFSSQNFPEQDESSADNRFPIAPDGQNFERPPRRNQFNGPPRGRQFDGPPPRRPPQGDRDERGRHQQRPNFRPAQARGEFGHQPHHGYQQPRHQQPLGDDYYRHESRELQVGQGLRLKLESFTPEGECVAHLGQFVVFVSGGIPGEYVNAIVTTTGTDFARARVERGDQRNRARTVAACRHFGTCGGCIWQHIEYPHQLKFKTQLLREMLEFRLGKVALPVHAMIPAPYPFGHRNKIFYQFDCTDPDTGQGIVFGHNRLHDPSLEWVRECPVHNQAGDKVARSVYRLLKDHNVPAATAHGMHDGLKSLLVRTSSTTGLSHVVFVATGEHLPLWQSVLEKTQRLPGVEGVHFNLQPDPLNTYLGRENRHISGEARLREKIGGVEFHVSPQSFFQTNAGAAQKLFEVVQRAVLDKACDPILDLYAGSGLFSLPLAQRGRTVVAVEENPYSVEDGQITAAANGITSCEFRQGKVEAIMRKMPRDRDFHTVILDPPREGVPEWILRLIGRGVRPKRMVYVSCNPQALARDLVLLLHSGYRLEEVQPVDMFPHTAHIESVAVLTRK